MYHNLDNKQAKLIVLGDIFMLMVAYLTVTCSSRASCYLP